MKKGTDENGGRKAPNAGSIPVVSTGQSPVGYFHRALFFSCAGKGVDGGLYKVYGSRLRQVLKTDLPTLALALVAYQRGRCTVWREFTHEIVWYRLFSQDNEIDVRVRGDDWKQIEPYLRSGAWNPQVTAVPQVGYLHPERHRAIPVLPTEDRTLYGRILDDLEQEFTRDFPTSNL